MPIDTISNKLVSKVSAQKKGGGGGGGELMIIFLAITFFFKNKLFKMFISLEWKQ